MDQARLRRLYSALPPHLQRAIPPGLEAWARARLAPPTGVQGLEDRLWGGFARAATAALTALAETGAPPEAAAAAGLLARWEAAHGRFEAALAWLRHPAAGGQVMLEALMLTQTGRGAEARALIAGARGFDASVALLRAGSWRPAAGEPGPEAEAAALAEITAVFARFGLQGIAKRDPAAPLGLDNLTGTAPGPRPGGRGRVSVLVPAFNAAATLATALRSLCEQTHGELEIIVVDDASEDATPEIALAFARADPRVRLLRQPSNQGGYAARNLGLAAATGDFVTVHDADDWSHPEKLERQLRQLRRSGAPSNFSAWVRATPELGFLGPARVRPRLLGLNDSSGLFRRDLFARFGGWDDARIAADKELIWRFEVLAGRPREAFRRRLVLPDCPLAFGRLTPSSLTRAGPTHVLTVYHGLRREYREAAAFWQDGLDPRPRAPGASARSPPSSPRPRCCAPCPAAAPAPELLVIADFNFQGGAQKSALAMLAAARAAHLSAALLHYRRYDQDVTEPLRAEVRRFAGAREVRILAPGEAVRARTVVVAYPPVFAEVMDRFPALEHDHLVVAVNQLAERDLDRADIAYDPARVRAHLAELLGSEGLWAPISGRVRARMAADPRYPAAHPDTWTPLIDAKAWGARAHGWRGAGRAVPVLGRHGRDHPLKWPRDPRALAAAYCAGKPCEVRFLGGAAQARARLARWPGNWRALPFGARAVPDFLAELDVFLHFPDPRYIEEFGRAPMEAMAAGVPVILPPEFEPTFGEAALYAPPEGVWELVARLWHDRALWEARAAAGRGFVAASCDYPELPAPPRPAGAVTLVSVIVPVHRHWPLVPGLLAALAAQELDADAFEVVIVDNDAPAPPPPLELPRNARVLPCPAPGAYAARNAGAAVARGRLLAFTDADCRPAPGWLAAFAAARAPGLLAGPVEMLPPPGPLRPCAAFDLVRGIPQARYVARGYAATANLAVPAALFRTLGGFDPARRSGGDAELCRRAGRTGHALSLVPGAVVVHPCRASWAELARKARRVKGGQVAAGPLPRRLAWSLRTLAPPLDELARLLAAPHPARARLLAAAVRLGLWGVELAETARLLTGGEPERR